MPVAKTHPRAQSINRFGAQVIRTAKDVCHMGQIFTLSIIVGVPLVSYNINGDMVIYLRVVLVGFGIINRVPHL